MQKIKLSFAFCVIGGGWILLERFLAGVADRVAKRLVNWDTFYRQWVLEVACNLTINFQPERSKRWPLTILMWIGSEERIKMEREKRGDKSKWKKLSLWFWPACILYIFRSKSILQNGSSISLGGNKKRPWIFSNRLQSQIDILVEFVKCSFWG